MKVQHERLFVELPELYANPDDLEKGLFKPERFVVKFEHHDGTSSTDIGHFSLEPMPGCCGVIVSTGSYLEPHQRGDHNISRWFHELKAETARKFGYTTMLMTTQLRNIPEVVGASRHKWRFFHYFRNKRTNNDIGIAVKDL